ncbi:MAG: histidine kinase dimerization/phosphoacceptor domain -containing protein [Bradyrhizobium sp.]
MIIGTAKAYGMRSLRTIGPWLLRVLPAAAVILVSASALLFDALTPDMISVDIFYVTLVLLGFWFADPKATLGLAVLATLLIFVGHWITIPGNTPEREVWFNRGLAVGTAWIAALFVWRIRVLERELQSKIDLANSLSREINHRVGNHLQLVASLLRRQAADSSEESRRALELAGSRVRTIGSINRELSLDTSPQTSPRLIGSKSHQACQGRAGCFG